MKIGIKYWQRLGDVIRLFPLAKHFSDQGHEVEILCAINYHEIFECVDYVKPTLCVKHCDIVHDLEIWNSFGSGSDQMRYADFRTSKKKWTDFIYDDFPDVEDRRNIQLTKTCFHDADYDLPSEYNLIAPFGMSQVHRWDINQIIKEAQLALIEKGNDLPTLILGQGVEGALNANKLYHLPKIIKDATDFFCINSAPSIIAGAVRCVQYHHFSEPSFDFQDDHENPFQIKHKPTL